MNINRNNYEDYFLLYVDNELSAAEKNSVELFVAANPDLQEELLMLQQSILKPENTFFKDKELLKRPEETEAGLLLLLDGELEGAEKQAVLSAIENSKSLAEEWDTLKKTKLPAETIVFENKASLYRKEERKVVRIHWWQMAAAAMLIGAGLWGTVSYMGDEQPGVTPPGLVTNNQPANITDDSLSGISKAKTTATAQAVKKNEERTMTSETAGKQNNQPAIKTPREKNNNSKTPQVEQRQENYMAIEKIKNEPLLKPGLQNINNNSSNKIDVAIVTPAINNEQINFKEAITAPVETTYAGNSSGGSDDETEFSFEEEEDKPKKSKIGGFFKKVKRVLERKTKIRTGSSDDIKIANMSFAMH